MHYGDNTRTGHAGPVDPGETENAMIMFGPPNWSNCPHITDKLAEAADSYLHEYAWHFLAGNRTN